MRKDYSKLYLQFSELNFTNGRPIGWRSVASDYLWGLTRYIHVLVQPFDRDDVVCKSALILDGEDKGHI